MKYALDTNIYIDAFRDPAVQVGARSRVSGGNARYAVQNRGVVRGAHFVGVERRRATGGLLSLRFGRELAREGLRGVELALP